MKKLILSAVAIAASLNLMAAITATVNIEMTGENSTATLLLVESDEYTSAFDNSHDATAAPGAAVYAYLGGNSLSKCWTNNLEEVEIRFAAAGTYTLKFSGVTGRALKFNGKTAENGESVTVTVSATEVGTKMVTITDATVAGKFEVCHQNGHITISNNKNTENIVIKVKDVEGETAGTVKDDVASTTTDIDLKSYKKGYYTIEGLDQDGKGTVLTIKVE